MKKGRAVDALLYRLWFLSFFDFIRHSFFFMQRTAAWVLCLGRAYGIGIVKSDGRMFPVSHTVRVRKRLGLCFLSNLMRRQYDSSNY